MFFVLEEYKIASFMNFTTDKKVNCSLPAAKNICYSNFVSADIAIRLNHLHHSSLLQSMYSVTCQYICYIHEFLSCIYNKK